MLFNDGAHANPAGRLPVTWIKTLNQVCTSVSILQLSNRYFDMRVTRHGWFSVNERLHGYEASFFKFRVSREERTGEHLDHGYHFQ